MKLFRKFLFTFILLSMAASLLEAQSSRNRPTRPAQQPTEEASIEEGSGRPEVQDLLSGKEFLEGDEPVFVKPDPIVQAEPVPGDTSAMSVLDTKRILKVGDRVSYLVEEDQDRPIILYVNRKGNVDVPLIGSVRASGKTAYTLATDIKKMLEDEYYYNATVVVQNNPDSENRGRIFVLGDVRQPGSYNLPSDEIITISQAVLRAGGLTPDADSSRVVLIRNDPDSETGEDREEYDVGDFLAGRNLADDAVVEPEDRIIVPRMIDSAREIYVLGAVNSPGVYTLNPNQETTISKAVLQAGGFTRFAKKTKVKLIRGNPDLDKSEKTIYVNVEEILDDGRRDKDIVLEANDTVQVEERLINF